MHSPGRLMDENHAIERPDRDLRYFLPLYRATIVGDWGAIQRFLEEDPPALTATITAFSETTLHIAVRKGLSLQVISRLVDFMSPDSLEIRDRNGETPLHSAGIVGNTEAARILYSKNPRLPQISNILGETPLHCAARFGHKETVNFLLQVTENDHPTYLYAGAMGVALLNYLIAADFYDIALGLVLRFPSLAAEHGDDESTALLTLAQKTHAFESGNKVGFLQRILYRGTVHMDLTEKAQAMLKLAQHLCEEALFIKEAERILSPALLKAATLGILQLVRLIINVYPHSIWFCDEDGRNIFHLAILFRRVEVFNLLYEMSLNKHHVLQLTDRFGNNILHLAGHLGPENTTLGPALQMQLDSQWFEEVEKLVQPSYKKMQNYRGMTPEETFAREHEELAKHGENWMTQVASAYAFVASLVTTVVFAGPFNVPGGTNNDGVPNFLHDLSFMIFMVSDGLALFASSISVLMFVSVVPSHDFRRYSPRMLSFGLVTLFISIASMLVAFGSSLYMVLVHRVSWVGVPIGLLCCVPATIVLVLLYPIISQIVLATFGPSIFGHKKHETLEY